MILNIELNQARSINTCSVVYTLHTRKKLQYLHKLTMFLARALMPILLLLAERAHGCFVPAAPGRRDQSLPQYPTNQGQTPTFPYWSLFLHPRMYDPNHLKRVRDQNYFHGQRPQAQKPKREKPIWYHWGNRWISRQTSSGRSNSSRRSGEDSEYLQEDSDRT